MFATAVEYPAIHRQGHLASYLVLLDRMDSNQLSRGHRLAFLINVYNPFAVKGILAHDSPETLFGRYRYFIAREYQVGGRTVSLYNLKREILIAQFHAPRMHFEFVCVSASCPKLPSWADEGQDFDQ